MQSSSQFRLMSEELFGVNVPSDTASLNWQEFVTHKQNCKDLLYAEMVIACSVWTSVTSRPHHFQAAYVPLFFLPKQ